jgi:hypothetical protein
VQVTNSSRDVNEAWLFPPQALVAFKALRSRQPLFSSSGQSSPYLFQTKTTILPIFLAYLHIATDMNSLPNELLIQVASYLDIDPPSATKFAHEPSTQLTVSDITPLKALSQVSWRWRKITLPILFRCTRLSLDKEPKWVPVDARLVDSMQTQLTSLSEHEFQVYNKMRSKFKSSSAFAFEEPFDDLLINLCQIQDGDKFFQSVPNILWLPHLPCSFENFGKFVAQYDLKHHIRSVVVQTDKEYELRHVTTANSLLDRAVGMIWSQIFSHLEPSRVVVAAPPATLAGLLNTQMLSSDTWAFDMKMHYIELRQPEPMHMDHSETHLRTQSAPLIHRRPWHHLAYNEGSSIPVYSTYEYHLKQSPKMLYLILLNMTTSPSFSCHITSFGYTGVFPLFTDVSTIVRALHKITTLKKIAFQFAPGAENNVLSEPKRLGRAQSSDFWLEWNENYKFIATCLCLFDFPDGAEFRSYDCGNEKLVSEVGGYIESLTPRGTTWRHSEEEKGVWIRDSSLDKEVTPATAEGII